MTTETLTLSAFLLARIEEDEVTAVAATPGPWVHNPRKEWFTDPDKLRASRAGIQQSGGEEYVGADGGSVGVAATGPCDDPQSMADARHIARNDPARVLATCKAHRAIVERCLAVLGDRNGTIGSDFWADESLRALASIYADHADFREEWAS